MREDSNQFSLLLTPSFSLHKKEGERKERRKEKEKKEGKRKKRKKERERKERRKRRKEDPKLWVR